MNTIPGVSLNGRPLARYAIVRASTFEHDRQRQKREAMKRRRTLLEIEAGAQSKIHLAGYGYAPGEPVPAMERTRIVALAVRNFTSYECPTEPAEFQAWFRRAIDC